MSTTATTHPTDSVPCHICGVAVGGGWIHGFSPSSNALKVGLCDRHDNPANRALAVAAWQVRLNGEIARMNAVELAKNTQQLWQLEIDFLEGGRNVLNCLACSAMGETLQVERPDKSLAFFPLRQVREYRLRPLFDDAKDMETDR